MNFALGHRPDVVAHLLAGEEPALADLTFTPQCDFAGSSPAQALCSRDDETVQWTFKAALLGAHSKSLLLQIPIVSHLYEMKTTLTAAISAGCADIKTRSKARMEESRRLKVS